MSNSNQHSFHIPVMGLAFTIDTPAKVARFGISSVISIVEDRIIEMMRSHYYPMVNQVYHPILTSEPDYRAKRITDYLNLLDQLVKAQVEKIKTALFETGSEIVKYFDMLPESLALKKLYKQMLAATDKEERKTIETYLRTQVRAGSIDVNIMTKVDRNRFTKKGVLIEDGSDAVAALRGYTNSNLENSSVIFSAGMNPRLYNYLENCPAFNPDENGEFTKKIIIKVSDYRSALIQGKYLAKKGIWVSEFRIESGLNCGGHAFATEGYLMGPILEEFKIHKQELVDTIFEIYNAAIVKKGIRSLSGAPLIVFSAQGGIGTFAEDLFLHHYYNITSTGWGTPFLLVPEATTVDDATLKLLAAAGEDEVLLSHNSPLGVRFHYLKGTTAEKEKLSRIAKGKPGSPCTEKHLALNTEFTKEPICTASQKYQQLKITQLKSLNLPPEDYNQQAQSVLDKECLCLGLSNSAAIKYEKKFIKNLEAVNICPGPNIANFSKVVSLQTMTDHIYGRRNIIANAARPNMFIAEINLYLRYLEEQLDTDAHYSLIEKKQKYYHNFYSNMKNGFNYYRDLGRMPGVCREQFTRALYFSEKRLDALAGKYGIIENRSAVEKEIPVEMH